MTTQPREISAGPPILVEIIAAYLTGPASGFNYFTKYETPVKN